MAFFPAPSLPYKGIGLVEDGDTASRAIEKDQIVIWKGGNYYAKTAILQGATFVVDTNLTAIPDGVVNNIVSKMIKNTDIVDNLTTNYSTKVLSAKQGKVISDHIAQMIVSETFTSGDVNVNAGGRESVSIPISKTGYTPIGIVSIYTPETQVMSIQTFYISNNYAIIGLYNGYSEARNAKTIVRILFLKN